MSDLAPPQTGTEEALYEAMAKRLALLLPSMYREQMDKVAPVSMGSAGLCFDAEGRVAWDRMWGSFCDLAMAGGPPHKGRLLLPATQKQVAGQPERYATVVAEIVRGIRLASGIEAVPSAEPGWIRLLCNNEAMAGWMLRAIVMENVSARGVGSQLELPSGPEFRIEKEIKNVITVVTKTAHYWHEHMPRHEQYAVARTLTRMDAEQPLLAPPYAEEATGERYTMLCRHIAEQAESCTGLKSGGPRYDGWIGMECGTVAAAIALMRLVLLSNVLTRREETVLYVPVNPMLDPDGSVAVQALRRAVGYMSHRGKGATLQPED